MSQSLSRKDCQNWSWIMAGSDDLESEILLWNWVCLIVCFWLHYEETYCSHGKKYASTQSSISFHKMLLFLKDIVIRTPYSFREWCHWCESLLNVTGVTLFLFLSILIAFLRRNCPFTNFLVIQETLVQEIEVWHVYCVNDTTA